MYADRYTRPGGLNPGGLGGALILTGAMVAGLIFSAPDFVKRVTETTITLNPIPIPDDPPPDPLPKPIDHAKPQPRHEQIVIPERQIETQQQTNDFDFTKVIPQPTDFGEIGTGKVIVPPADPPPPPLLDAQTDPRFAAGFQPTYPPDERRAEREGRVVVRVLIGVDGRVSQVERISATSDSFFSVTERQALGKWRFRPATRGGVPEAQWRTMSVRFVLNS